MLAVNGIQAELKLCSGNSTVSDFRLNKGTMFYFYPSLRKDGWLTRMPKLLLVPHMWGEKLCVCACQSMKDRAWGRAPAAVVSACRSSMRSSYLLPAKPWPGPCLLHPLSPSASFQPGFPPVCYRQGSQVKWAIPIQGQECCTNSPCEMAAHFGRSMHSLSFVHCHWVIASKKKKGVVRGVERRERWFCMCCLFVCMWVGEWVFFVCVCTCMCGGVGCLPGI